MKTKIDPPTPERLRLKRRSLPEQVEYWQTKWHETQAEVGRLREEADARDECEQLIFKRMKAAEAVCEMVSVFEELSPERLTPLLKAWRQAKEE